MVNRDAYLNKLYDDHHDRIVNSKNIWHLLTGPEGNSEFSFPRYSIFQTLRFEGNKIHCFPRDQSLGDLLYSNTKRKLILKIPATSDHLQLHAQITCNSGQHFAGNSELLTIWRHNFRNVTLSWHLAGNSFIVRCHVTMSQPMNRCTEAEKTPAI